MDDKSTHFYSATSQDVANATGFHVGHIRRMARNDEIPHIRMGRRKLWFNLDEVLEVLVTKRLQRNESVSREVGQSDTCNMVRENEPEVEVDGDEVDDIFGL